MLESDKIMLIHVEFPASWWHLPNFRDSKPHLSTWGFSRQISSNPSVAPCVVCNGQSASQKQIPGLAPTPNVAVVAVEPSDSNFQLLLRHSKEHGWEHEAFLPLKAREFIKFHELWYDYIWFMIWFMYYIYNLRAAAPAADPGRIGKEAKQIGIKTLRCFAPWGFRPFSYVYCCEIYLIGLNFHL